MNKKIVALFTTVFLTFSSALTVSATNQDVNSYNPTEPEKQLGIIKTIDIDESGTVSLNKHSLQGSLDKNGDVYIETVKRPKVFASDDKESLKIYYFLDKDGDIFSMKLNQDSYLEDKEENQITLKKVSFLEGRNGVADKKDGFKSNLVPEKFLPKTDLKDSNEALNKTEKEIGQFNPNKIINPFYVFISLFVLLDILIVNKLFFQKKKRIDGKEDIEND